MIRFSGKLVPAGLALAMILSACGNNHADQQPAATPDSSVSEEVKPGEPLIAPVRYKDWEMGNSKDINTVLELYLKWDDKDIEKLTHSFSDTVVLRIPTERTEVAVPHDKIAAALKNNMKQYKTTSNEIVSALSVHEKSTNTDWVMITAYSKWVEQSGKKDSLIYHDDWQLKDGKVIMLVSFQKLPVKHFLEKVIQ